MGFFIFSFFSSLFGTDLLLLCLVYLHMRAQIRSHTCLNVVYFLLILITTVGHIKNSLAVFFYLLFCNVRAHFFHLFILFVFLTEEIHESGRA